MGTRFSPGEVSAELARRLAATGVQPALDRLASSFPQQPFYVYGGAVRDAALGRFRGDYDFDIFVGIPDLDPLESFLSGWGEGEFERNPIFRNIYWWPNPSSLGVLDLVAKGNIWWPCEEVRDLLRGVDLTINALAYDLRTGEIVDPCNGLEDLKNGIARALVFDRHDTTPGALGIPLSAANWFRILHFSAVLGLEIEPSTADWLVQHRTYRRFEPVFAHAFFPPRLDALDRLPESA